MRTAELGHRIVSPEHRRGLLQLQLLQARGGLWWTFNLLLLHISGTLTFEDNKSFALSIHWQINPLCISDNIMHVI